MTRKIWFNSAIRLSLQYNIGKQQKRRNDKNNPYRGRDTFIAVLLMGVKIFSQKKEIPDIHIGDNKAMQERGIGCATSQDAQIRSKINPVKQILKSKP